MDRKACPHDISDAHGQTQAERASAEVRRGPMSVRACSYKFTLHKNHSVTASERKIATQYGAVGLIPQNMAH